MSVESLPTQLAVISVAVSPPPNRIRRRSSLIYITGSVAGRSSKPSTRLITIRHGDVNVIARARSSRSAFCVPVNTERVHIINAKTITPRSRRRPYRQKSDHEAIELELITAAALVTYAGESASYYCTQTCVGLRTSLKSVINVVISISRKASDTASGS